VRHGAAQQLGIGKPMTEALLEGGETGVHGSSIRIRPRPYLERPSYLINKKTGLISSISLL
jgi:hypothetical protein